MIILRPTHTVFLKVAYLLTKGHQSTSDECAHVLLQVHIVIDMGNTRGW